MNRLDSSAEDLALITSRVRGQSDDAGQEALQQRVQPGVENEDRGPDEDELDKHRRPANDCHIGIRCAPDVIFDSVNEERAEEEAGAGAPAVRCGNGFTASRRHDPCERQRPNGTSPTEHEADPHSDEVRDRRHVQADPCGLEVIRVAPSDVGRAQPPSEGEDVQDVGEDSHGHYDREQDVDNPHSGASLFIESSRHGQRRILPKNIRVRSCFGLWKISSGDPSSMIRPASMNRIRFATSLANPISCVTTIIVMPSLARAAIASSTSRMYSGSRADVGSSNNMALGFMARARAMATRCCWPPDNCAGYASALSARPTRANSFRPWAPAVVGSVPRTRIGPRVTFWSAVRCAKRLKLWNTMPTC